MRQKGFTIVELLIVIVVIAILAAVTIVAYNGVQNRASDAAVQSDLKSIGTILHNYITINGGLPTTDIENTLMNTVLSNPEMNAKATREGYDVTSPAASGDTNSRNLLICISGGVTDPKFGIGALSKSGSVFFFTSNGGLVKDSTPWVGQQTATCPKLGITVGSSGYARTFGHERALSAPVDTGWKTWTQ